MSSRDYMRALPDELLKCVLESLAPTTVSVRFVRLEEPISKVWKIGIRPIHPSTELLHYLDIAKQSTQLHRCAWEVLASNASLHIVNEEDVIPPTIPANPHFDADLTYLLQHVKTIFISDVIGMKLEMPGMKDVEELHKITYSIQRSKKGTLEIPSTDNTGINLAYRQSSVFRAVLDDYFGMLEFRLWDFAQTGQDLGDGESLFTEDRVYRLVDLPTTALGVKNWANGKVSMLSRERTFEVRAEFGRRCNAEG